MVPERHRKKTAGRRAWTYGLVDLLVIAACSLVFVAVVTGSKATTRRPAPEERSREAGLATQDLHQPAAHRISPANQGPWTPSRPR